MMKRQIALCLLLAALAAEPAEAKRCHKIWRYPWPQQCGLVYHAQVHHTRLARRFYQTHRTLLVEIAVPIKPADPPRPPMRGIAPTPAGATKNERELGLDALRDKMTEVAVPKPADPPSPVGKSQ